MKSLLTTAAMMLIGTSAMAIDITPSFSLDSTIDVWYNTETNGDTTTAMYELKPVFAPGAGVEIYGDIDVDIEDPEYDGITLGVDWEMPSTPVETTLSAKTFIDDAGERGDIMVGASFSF